MMAATSSASVSTGTTTFNSQHSFYAASLQEDRRLVQRLFIDFIVCVLIVIPIPIFEFGLDPYRRGFFCNDETIRYPFHANTVTNLMLGLLVGLVPALVIIAVEILRSHRKGQIVQVVYIFGWKLPIWLIEYIRQMVYFSIGLALTFDATEVGKYTIGRLRPHFIAVCQPQIDDGSDCTDLKNQYRYIEDYVCRAEGFSAADLLESRRSFPSGHSSITFYAMVYISIHIQRRLVVRGSKLTPHFLQFLALMVAWFVALSRIMDNWHHWSDVLVGALIGIVGAVLTARFISKLHRRHTAVSSFAHTNTKDAGKRTNLGLNLPRQDTSATLDVVVSTPPPYTPNTEHSFSNEQYCTKV